MTFLKQPSFFAVAVAVAVLFSASPVLADAIDGNWCNGVKRLEISGAKIVTPGGNSIDGIYGRHDFTYTVPAGEPGAGASVDMELLGDDDLRVWPNGRSPDPQKAGAQMWKRCAAPVS
ncbi:MAG: hypothetical protein ACI9JL_003784 [Paracoccaceae bacterium]|jgi:hypothetical protein